MKIHPDKSAWFSVWMMFLILLILDAVFLYEGASVLFVSLFSIPLFLLLLFQIFSVCKTMEFSSAGCIISLPGLKRQYTWDDIVVVRLENCENTRGATNLTYEEGVLFATRPVRRPKYMKLADFCLFRHPFSSFFVTFPSVRMGNLPKYRPSPYPAEKASFLAQLRDWGVTVENS